jgi:hypothetical protein
MNSYLRKILIYLAAGLIPYYLTKKISAKGYENDDLNSNSVDAGKVRGGDNSRVSRIISYILNDSALKVSLTSLFGVALFDAYSEAIVNALVKASPQIATLSSIQARSINLPDNVVDILTLPESDAIKTIVLNSKLSAKGKTFLFKIQLQKLFKGLSGKQRIWKYCSLIALLLFICGGGTPAFAAFLAALREFINSGDLDRDVIRAIITAYREVNAPLPNELSYLIDLIEE